jgi:hypothetical protein
MSIVDVKACSFTSRVNKSKAPTNSRFDWLIDNYDTPVNTGIIDGTDVSQFSNHAANRARIGNYAQEWRRTAQVSRRSENISHVAGVPSERAQAVAKKLVELKRDVESTLLAGNDGQADTGSVPYLTIGLDKWIDTTGPTAPYSVPATFRTATAQIETTAAASLTETKVQDVLAAIFDNTGMIGDYVLFAGSVLRRAFTDFTRTGGTAGYRSRVFNYDGSSGKVSQTTTIYEGDFGNIEILPSSFMGGSTLDTDRGYLLDMDKIHLRTEQRPMAEALADEGGGPRFLVSTIAGLQVDNPIGLGKFKP